MSSSTSSTGTTPSGSSSGGSASGGSSSGGSGGGSGSDGSDAEEGGPGGGAPDGNPRPSATVGPKPLHCSARPYSILDVLSASGGPHTTDPITTAIGSSPHHASMPGPCDGSSGSDIGALAQRAANPVRRVAGPGAGIFRLGQVRSGPDSNDEGPRTRGKSWCSGGQDSEVRFSDWNG